MLPLWMTLHGIYNCQVEEDVAPDVDILHAVDAFQMENYIAPVEDTLHGADVSQVEDDDVLISTDG